MHIFRFQSNGRYRQVLSKKFSWKDECGKIGHFGGEQTYSFLCCKEYFVKLKVPEPFQRLCLIFIQSL